MENDNAHMKTHACVRWLNKRTVDGSTIRGTQQSHFALVARVERSACKETFKGEEILRIGLN
jgi:hypothetical protein